MPNLTPPPHGGRIKEAAKEFGIPEQEWLDLSTGINPNGWTPPEIPSHCWQRLPESNDGLEDAARQYYGYQHLLPTAGSQAAIQALPLIIPKCRVGLLNPSYAEHQFGWQKAGHQVVLLSSEQLSEQIDQLDSLVLVNPNNPTADQWPEEQLLEWHQQLRKRNGWLIVDEAFVDSTPELSLAPFANRDGLIILRSLGKFFGLAGARCGFILSTPHLLKQLDVFLGPWSLTGPSRYIAKAALSDKIWQSDTRQHLQLQGKRLGKLLNEYTLTPNGSHDLFHWVQTEQAFTIFNDLAQLGILTRRFEQPDSLRFGLPGTEQEWQRLERALQQLTENTTP